MASLAMVTSGMFAAMITLRNCATQREVRIHCSAEYLFLIFGQGTNSESFNCIHTFLWFLIGNGK